MKRRFFLQSAGFSLLATLGTMLPLGFRKGKTGVEPMSVASLVSAADPDNMPDRCRSGGKDLTRCRNHYGSCEGGWHACSGHQGRCGTEVQCKDHNKKRPTRNGE